MKILLVMIYLSTFMFAGEASTFAKELGYLNSYATALKKAKKEHKILMLVEIEDGCPWCYKFVNTTLRTKAIKRATQRFVRVIVDRHTKLPIFFQTSFVPIVFFIDPYTQSFIVESIGYHNPKRFLLKISKVKKTVKFL